jgi:hypothetical protein
VERTPFTALTPGVVCYAWVPNLRREPSEPDSAETPGKYRPAVVVDASQTGVVVCPMSTLHHGGMATRWENGVDVEAWLEAGLTRPSRVLPRRVTVERRLVSSVLGALAAPDWQRVQSMLVRHTGSTEGYGV